MSKRPKRVEPAAATNTGHGSAATVANGASVAIATGANSRAKAGAGSAIVLVFRNDDGSIRHIRAAIAGGSDVKPDTWYTLDGDGMFVEVQP